MDARSAREYLLDRPDAWEDYPFGPDVTVFKISSRMFVILDGSVPACELERMMDRSYALVAGGLSKTERDRLVLVHGGEAFEHS